MFLTATFPFGTAINQKWTGCRCTSRGSNPWW